MITMLRTAFAVLLATLMLLAACGPEPGVDAPDPIRKPTTLGEVATTVKLPLPLQLLTAAIGTRKLVLLGEMHGTQEAPGLAGDLVVNQAGDGRRVILALEISSLEQPLVDRYMASAGSQADKDALLAGEHWQDPNHDGRDSQAMFALIEQVRALRHRGAEVSIDFFDEPGEQERNRQMADHLRGLVQREPQATVLVLTGNVHAMTAKPPWVTFNDGLKIEPPISAGRYLLDLQPLSINISAAGGEMWVCMMGECGVHPVVAARSGFEEATLEFSAPSESAWNADLVLPRFTASRPAVDGSPE